MHYKILNEEETKNVDNIQSPFKVRRILPSKWLCELSKGYYNFLTFPLWQIMPMFLPIFLFLNTPLCEHKECSTKNHQLKHNRNSTIIIVIIIFPRWQLRRPKPNLKIQCRFSLVSIWSHIWLISHPSHHNSTTIKLKPSPPFLPHYSITW